MTGRGRAAAWSISKEVFFFCIFGKSYARGGRETKKIITVALRGGEDSERGETKFSAGVTVPAPTTMHAEERQQSVPRDVQKCEQED